MRKLNLRLEDLTVDTFATGPDGARIGTVRANDSYYDDDTAEPVEGDVVTAPVVKSYDTQCYSICFTCDAQPTCRSCQATRCPTGMDPVCCA